MLQGSVGKFLDHPKNAFLTVQPEELGLSYFHTFSPPLSHQHIASFQGSFPSTSGMLYAGIIPAGKQKPLACTGPPWKASQGALGIV